MELLPMLRCGIGSFSSVTAPCSAAVSLKVSSARSVMDADTEHSRAEDELTGLLGMLETLGLIPHPAMGSMGEWTV